MRKSKWKRLDAVCGVERRERDRYLLDGDPTCPAGET